jgi:hypothetical protein
MGFPDSRRLLSRCEKRVVGFSSRDGAEGRKSRGKVIAPPSGGLSAPL